MTKIAIINNGLIKINKSVEGETIEDKIDRIVNNGEPISDGAPLIYTDRDEGIQPGYDIRTDRFDIAIDAMTQVSKATIAKRDELSKQRKEGNTDGKPPEGVA